MNAILPTLIAINFLKKYKKNRKLFD